MQEYYFIEVSVPLDLEDSLDHQAHAKFMCQGVEDFAIEEAKVDEILGERSYSGGDVPESVIYEVEEVLEDEGTLKKYFFDNKGHASRFKHFLLETYKLDSKLISEEIKDWNEEWKKTYAPILVDESLEIIPEWEKGKYQSSSKNQIYIYPGQGFGTGSHETTFLCLKLFTTLNLNKSSTCLDFGCGSGILGIAHALINKNAGIDLYDIDPEALENCKQNIELNDLDQSSFNLLLPSERTQIEKTYDVVFANILLNILLLELDYLANSVNEGGFLILSGLLVPQEEEVLRSYLSKNKELKHLKTEIKGDWIAILLQRSK